MTSKFMRISLAVAVFAISALAQTSSATTPSGSSALPAAPSSAPAAAPTTGTRLGTININEAIFGSNEGRRDIDALQKKFEPKQSELKSQSDELDALKKQLNDQGPKLNEDAVANLRKQIESKQKLFDRSVQDAQEDFRGQQQEIMSRILSKMAPMIVKYAQESGLGMIVDTSTQWPQSPILWAGENVDITKAIIDSYNTQSGVAAPPTTGSTAPKAPARPATGTTPKPSTSTPPK
jgi:outer membrane protein